MIQDDLLMSLIYSGDYELIVRQQPREALLAQSGKEKSKCRSQSLVMARKTDRNGLEDRKPIDPPPIVQLKVPEIKDPIR